MTTLDSTTLDATTLAPMLRSWAAGLFTGEAAVELLIAHDTWLHRADFRGRLVDAVDDGWARDGGIEPMASIDWDAVEDFLTEAPCSTSEAGILRLAASLAGTEVTTPLAMMTASLDDTNAALVLDALAHRFGWHERGHTHRVTGLAPLTPGTAA
jgi:hypothetical protein